ncbi:hypothetical protein Bache_3191 [Bacteroides helcogenes P 36-108]|uniref:Uncharacterized protein n=1 Tax=Bacteroides helcogenes (strain ATCC 35417 / DSM 20613 / JCM 6297 / CCUG 15421 / P 36-108) TaxID=693979 RepID=E6SRM5_BACT6|nr:hypothetical protein Bache_3191 [Bacteroides helcogenes P 36-108]
MVVQKGIGSFQNRTSSKTTDFLLPDSPNHLQVDKIKRNYILYYTQSLV